MGDKGMLDEETIFAKISARKGHSPSDKRG